MSARWTGVLRNERYDWDRYSDKDRLKWGERSKHSNLRDTKTVVGYEPDRQFKTRTWVRHRYKKTFWSLQGWQCRCCLKMFCFDVEDSRRYRRDFWEKLRYLEHHGLGPLHAIDYAVRSWDMDRLIRVHCLNEAGEPVICYKCHGELVGGDRSIFHQTYSNAGPDDAATLLAAYAYLAWFDWWKRRDRYDSRPFP